MGHYHCEIYKIKRGGGGGAVKKAAYNSGEQLHDNEQKKDFSFDKPEVLESKILLPKDAPARLRDRATLWNEATKAEKDSKGIIAREFEIAIPNNLTKEQAKRLVNGFAKTLARQGMCVDYSIHWKDGNHHAHILTTTRKLDKNGNFEKAKEKKVLARDENGNKIPMLDENGKQKVRVREGKGVEKLWQRVTIRVDPFRNKNTYKMWRKRWQNFTNAALKMSGSKDRVSCLSYKERGIDKVPQVHEGRVAREIEKRGGNSFLCEHNRKVKAINKRFSERMDELDKKIAKLKEQKNERNEIKICSYKDLTLEEKKAVAKKVVPILKEMQADYCKRYPSYRSQFRFKDDFTKNSVWAKRRGGLHLLDINKKDAMRCGLLEKAGGAKKLAGGQLMEMGKSTVKVGKAIKGLLDDKVSGEEHLEAVKDNIVDIVKTPPKAIADIIKNPVTGILSLPAKLFKMISSAAEAGVNALGAVGKGGTMLGEQPRTRSR